MDIWLALSITVAALIVGYVFGTRQQVGRLSLPELARLWEIHLASERRGELDAVTSDEAYRSGLQDMARAIVIGDPPPSLSNR